MRAILFDDIANSILGPMEKRPALGDTNSCHVEVNFVFELSSAFSSGDLLSLLCCCDDSGILDSIVTPRLIARTRFIGSTLEYRDGETPATVLRVETT